MNTTQKIVISNSKKEPITMMLEPWGEDYTLLSNDRFTIEASGCGSNFYFYIDYEENYFSVYLVGDSEYPSVYKDEQILECGYNREFCTDE